MSSLNYSPRAAPACFSTTTTRRMHSRLEHKGTITPRATSASPNAKPTLTRFPEEYPQAIKQAQEATLLALEAGIPLLEIEFPTASLSSVAGDAEGANEMTYSLNFIRQYTRIFQQRAASMRIFFPDQQEMNVAIRGKGKDPAAGSWDIDPVFDQTKFKLDYLTKPSGLLDIGIDLSNFNPADRAKDTDDLFLAAYPHFDPRELVAVDKLWAGAARDSGRPLILFNAELDRLRSNYYPSLFYPQMARLSREFIPLVETVYYIHNFKGAGGGALFRVYPEPWQVFLRLNEGMLKVHTQEERPTLKEVALDILPRAVRKLQTGEFSSSS